MKRALVVTLATVAMLVTLTPATQAGINFGAFPPPKAAPPPPSAPTVLSRQNLIVAGTLASGGGAAYTVDYRPLTEALGKPAPWLLRMTFTPPPNVPPNSIGFTVLDQTDPLVQGSSAGHVQTSVSPTIGGDFTSVPAGTDTSTIQQAVLSAASPGTFSVTLFNGASGPANYVLQLFPLLGGQLEPGINSNPPIPTPPPASGARPGPSTPAQAR